MNNVRSAASSVVADPTYSVRAEISREMVRLYKRQFGRGPARARTEFAGPDIVISILEDSFSTLRGEARSPAGSPVRDSDENPTSEASMSCLRAFRLIERDLQPACREIQVEGELDLAVAEQLTAGLVRAGKECRQVLISLESCEFIDSTGIAAIVHAHNQLAEQGVRIAVYAPSSQVLRVLSLTGLTANGMVFESAEEALSAIAPQSS